MRVPGINVDCAACVVPWGHQKVIPNPCAPGMEYVNNIGPENHPNASKYTIHGAYGAIKLGYIPEVELWF